MITKSIYSFVVELYLYLINEKFIENKEKL